MSKIQVFLIHCVGSFFHSFLQFTFLLLFDVLSCCSCYFRILVYKYIYLIYSINIINNKSYIHGLIRMTPTLEYYEEHHKEKETTESGCNANACHDIIGCIELDTQPLPLDRLSLLRLIVELLEELTIGR